MCFLEGNLLFLFMRLLDYENVSVFRRKVKKAARKKPTRKSIFEIYEPSELKRGHFTDMDNQVCELSVHYI